jgi:hypothetical protein
LFEAYVMVRTAAAAGTLKLTALNYLNGGSSAQTDLASVACSTMTAGTWVKLQGWHTVPASKNGVRVQLRVDAAVPSGRQVVWTGVRVTRKAAPLLLPAEGTTLAIGSQLWPNDGQWHDSDQNVQVALDPGVWLLTAPGYGRVGSNAAFYARLGLWNDAVSAALARGPNFRCHSEGQASDMPVWLTCVATVAQAGNYRMRMTVANDPGSTSNVTFVYMNFAAVRIG